MTNMTSSNALTIVPTAGSLDSYMQSVNSIPMLTAEEEKELAEKFYYNEDLDAVQRIIMSHLRFVVHIAKSYSGYGLPQADLIQEGNVGLMKAVKRFDPSVGVRIVSFAVHWIKAEIHEYVLKNWRIVKVATTKAQRKLFFNLRKSKKRLGWFNNEEVGAVADALGVSTSDVLEMETRMSSQDQAFDLSADDDEKSSGTFSPAQYLEDTDSDLANEVEGQQWEDHTNARLINALSVLDERSQDIISSRWLHDDNKLTLQELAGKYNVSAERVRQLEKNAMKKLRGAIGEL